MVERQARDRCGSWEQGSLEPSSCCLSLGARCKGLAPCKRFWLVVCRIQRTLDFGSLTLVRLWSQPQRLLEQRPVGKHIGVSAAKHTRIHATWGEYGLEILSVLIKPCHHMVPSLRRKLDFLSFLDFKISNRGCGHV